MDTTKSKSAETVESWRVFISYRSTLEDGQPDLVGRQTAQWLHESLKGCTFEIARDAHGTRKVVLDPYFDQTAPAISDFRKKLVPHLQTSKALVLICTSGAMVRKKGRDWLYQEIDWWQKNRRTSPILVDSTGTGEDVVPPPVRRRYPHAQRLDIPIDDWQALSDEEQTKERDRTTSRIVSGLIESEVGVRYEELARLRKYIIGLAAMVVIAVLAAIGLWNLTVSLQKTLIRVSRQAYSGAIATSDVLIETHNFSDARRRLNQTEPELRGWEYGHLAFRSDRSLSKIEFEGRRLGFAVFLPDGRIVISDHSGGVHVWDPGIGTDSSHEQVMELTQQGHQLCRIAVDSVSRKLVIADRNGQISVWDADSLERILDPVLVHKQGVISIVIKPGGGKCITSASDGTVKEWPLDDPGNAVEIKTDDEELTNLSYNDTGELVALTRSSRLWIQDNSGSIRKSSRLSVDILRGLCFSEEAEVYAVGDYQGNLQLVDCDTLESAGGFNLAQNPGAAQVLDVVADPVQDRIAATTSDGLVFLIGNLSIIPSQERLLVGHDLDVNSAAFNQNGTLLVTSSDDGTARLWSLSDSEQPVISLDHQGLTVWSACCQPNVNSKNSLVFTGDETGGLWQWKLAPENETSIDNSSVRLVSDTKRLGERNRIDQIVFHPSGEQLAAIHEFGQVSIWKAGEQRGDQWALSQILIPQDDKRYESAAFHPTENWIVLGTHGGVIEATNRCEIITLKSESSSKSLSPVLILDDLNPVYELVISPDGKHLVVASVDETLRLFSIKSRDQLNLVRLFPTLATEPCLFHPSKKLLITSWGADTKGATNSNNPYASIAVWNLSESGESQKTALPSAVFVSHTKPIRSLNFNKSGSRLITAAEDGQAKLWMTDTQSISDWQELLTLRPPLNKLGSPSSEIAHYAGFANNERDVIVARNDIKVLVWRSRSFLRADSELPQANYNCARVLVQP